MSRIERTNEKYSRARQRRWYPIECEHGYDCCPICDGARRDPLTLNRIHKSIAICDTDPAEEGTMTTQERAACYEDCAKLVEEWALTHKGPVFFAAARELIRKIGEHKADPVKYP